MNPRRYLIPVLLLAAATLLPGYASSEETKGGKELKVFYFGRPLPKVQAQLEKKYAVKVLETSVTKDKKEGRSADSVLILSLSSSAIRVIRG